MQIPTFVFYYSQAFIFLDLKKIKLSGLCFVLFIVLFAFFICL